jgi:transposase
MARAYSQDLRDRVIDAALAGLPARRAAVQFRVGIATAIGWVSRARQSGERAARRQGQPRRSKLDPHGAFLLGLIEATPDMTLVEMQEHLTAERGITASVGTIWTFLDRCGLTMKKSPRMPPNRIGPTFWSSAVVRGPARSRPGPTGLHRRDRRLHRHGAPARPGAEG